MKLINFSTTNLKDKIKNSTASKLGQKIMLEKSEILSFELKDLSIAQANIIKQTALATGAELALPKEAIYNTEGIKSAILFGTKRTLNALSQKLQSQPFNLKNLALEIKAHLSNKNHKKKLMAVINLTEDSLYQNSRFNTNEAIAKIEELISKGADYIDIGAASSRPNSPLVDSKIEIEKLKNVCEFIKNLKDKGNTKFSIDTYNPATANFALDYGFDTINDILGLDDNMLKVASTYQAEVVLMHSRGVPATMQTMCNYDDVVLEIDKFFASKLERIEKHNLKNIILDIGFGFAKTPHSNLSLINALPHFKKYDLPILVGVSMKSTIGHFTGLEIDDRLAPTIALGLYALDLGASILRVHNFNAHKSALQMLEALHMPKSMEF